MHSPIVSNVCVTKNRAPYYEDIYLVYKTRVNVVMAVFRLSAAPLTEAHWGHTLMRKTGRLHKESSDEAKILEDMKLKQCITNIVASLSH